MVAVMRKHDKKSHEATTKLLAQRYVENPRVTVHQTVADFKPMAGDRAVSMYEQDIRDLVHDLKRRERGVLLEHAEIPEILEEDLEIFHKAKFSDGESGRLEFVFWTNDWAIRQWRLNPEVTLFDNTYKTNKFNLPLARVCGVTGSHASFNMGWCLMMNENEDAFSWMFR